MSSFTVVRDVEVDIDLSREELEEYVEEQGGSVYWDEKAVEVDNSFVVQETIQNLESLRRIHSNNSVINSALLEAIRILESN